MPEFTTDYGTNDRRPVITQLVGFDAQCDILKRPVIAPTGMLDAELKYLERDVEPSSLDMLEMEGSSDDLPVWLYGNLWADSEPEEGGDSHLRLMGVGA